MVVKEYGSHLYFHILFIKLLDNLTCNMIVSFNKAHNKPHKDLRLISLSNTLVRSFAKMSANKGRCFFK